MISAHEAAHFVSSFRESELNKTLQRINDTIDDASKKGQRAAVYLLPKDDPSCGYLCNNLIAELTKKGFILDYNVLSYYDSDSNKTVDLVQIGIMW